MHAFSYLCKRTCSEAAVAVVVAVAVAAACLGKRLLQHSRGTRSAPQPDHTKQLQQQIAEEAPSQNPPHASVPLPRPANRMTPDDSYHPDLAPSWGSKATLHRPRLKKIRIKVVFSMSNQIISHQFGDGVLTGLEDARHLGGFWRRRLIFHTEATTTATTTSRVEFLLLLLHQQQLLPLPLELFAPPLNLSCREPLLLLLKHNLFRIQARRIVDQNAKNTKGAVPLERVNLRQKRERERERD
jgi:hypothetical protein